MRPQLIPLAIILALSACDAPPDDAPTPGPAASPASAPPAPAATPSTAQAPARLAATGPALTITAEADPGLQTAASVVRVDPLAGQGPLTVKLIGMGGGDPAMNGLHTWLAVFRSPAEGWAMFRIADVLDYRILSEAPGRVDLELTESRLDAASGEIGQGRRRVIVAWPLGAEGAVPAAVTVTPAR